MKYFQSAIDSITPEAVTGGVLSKNVFVIISQNSQENTFVGVSILIKLLA